MKRLIILFSTLFIFSCTDKITIDLFPSGTSWGNQEIGIIFSSYDRCYFYINDNYFINVPYTYYNNEIILYLSLNDTILCKIDNDILTLVYNNNIYYLDIVYVI